MIDPIHYPYVPGDGYCLEAYAFKWDDSGWEVSVVRDVSRETRQPIGDDWRIRLTYIRTSWRDRTQAWDEPDVDLPEFTPASMDEFRTALAEATDFCVKLLRDGAHP